MQTKETMLEALELLMMEHGLAKSRVGRSIANDPKFVDRLRDPASDIQTRTLDNVWRYILEMRGQLDLDLK